MLSASGIMESSMSKAGLDNRHRNKDGEICHKHGNTLIRTLRKIYGQGFAAGSCFKSSVSNPSVNQPVPRLRESARRRLEGRDRS
jgi:hypothetical protein